MTLQPETRRPRAAASSLATRPSSDSTRRGRRVQAIHDRRRASGIARETSARLRRIGDMALSAVQRIAARDLLRAGSDRGRIRTGLGSVSAKDPIRPSVAMAGKSVCYCPSEPPRMIVWEPIPILVPAIDRKAGEAQPKTFAT